MDGGACWAAVLGVAKSWMWLSDFTFTFHFHALEEEMATHSSVLAWRIPGTGGAWWAAVYGVAKSWTRLSDFTFTFHFHALGKEMATHSSVLAWRIPGTGEPGGLLSMGSHRVGHDWSAAAAAAFLPGTLSLASLFSEWKRVFSFLFLSCCGTLSSLTREKPMPPAMEAQTWPLACQRSPWMD